MKKSLLIIWIIALFNITCIVKSNNQYHYQKPEKNQDGLEVGSLGEVGIHKGVIESAALKILNGKFKEVHAMLIVKDEKLVFEEYFPGHDYQWDATYHHGEVIQWNRDTPHNIMSNTKSITSACIGIAIDQGYIKSVHQSIFDFLPDHQNLKSGGKEKITIEHLLTMTSGLEWREWSAPYSSAANPIIGIWFQDKDPISFILGFPLIAEPGTRFNYSIGNMVLLGEILHNATGMSIDDFSQQYLFNPLEIENANWGLKYENGVDANNLEITPRAMAKIGLLYLNRGVWKGKRIISEEWIEKSINPYPGNEGIDIPGEDSGRNGYSNSWWIHEISFKGEKISMYYAGGWGGQHIMVIPEYNLVIVFTGGNFVTKRPPFKILRRYIIPSLNG